MNYYMGVDCGLDGGIVVLRPDGSMMHNVIMPTMKAGKGRLIDIGLLDQMFDQWKEAFPGLCIGIEDPGKHAPSAMGLWSMTRSFTVIETLAIVYGFRHDTINSRKWQKIFWTKPKMAKGVKYDTKAAALLAACKLWPDVDWTPTERSSKPHDGLIDAALIAEYMRRLLK